MADESLIGSTDPQSDVRGIIKRVNWNKFDYFLDRCRGKFSVESCTCLICTFEYIGNVYKDEGVLSRLRIFQDRIKFWKN